MTGWIITKWKESGIYRIEDSINGKIYKSDKVAQKVSDKIGYMEYVVRSV